MVVAIEKNHPCTRMVRVAPLSDWANTPVTFTPGHPKHTVVLSITPLVLPTSECFATSRLQETKGFQPIDALNTLRFQLARSRLKSRNVSTILKNRGKKG